MEPTTIVITNHNRKEIKTKIECDEEGHVIRVDVKLKKLKKVKNGNINLSKL